MDIGLIAMLLIVIALYCAWDCCKANPNWQTGRLNTQPEHTGREVIRAWRYRNALDNRSDPWMQKVDE